jgi:hypothetical protein
MLKKVGIFHLYGITKNYYWRHSSSVRHQNRTCLCGKNGGLYETFCCGLGGSGAERDTLNLEAEGVKTQHNQLCFTYKTQKRFAFNPCGISGDCLGENDAVFLIYTFRRET